MPVLIEDGGEAIELRPGGGDLRYSSEAFAGWDGGPLLSGRPVSYARMFATQPWVAVTIMRLLTWAIRVPLKTYRRTGPDGGDKERLRPGEHPLADALAAPWKRGSQADLIMAALGPQCVQGNGLLGVRSPIGRFCFQPIDWRHITAVHEVETDPTSPVVAWKVFPPGGEPYSIGASNVLHFRWWSPFGQLGVSPLRQLQTTLRNETAAMDWSVNNLRNAWRPSGVVELSDKAMEMNPEQMFELYARSVEKLREKYSGPENAGRLPVIPPGLKWATAEQTTAVEAELVNQRMVNRNEVAAIYQVPPPMIGQLERCLPGDALVSTDRGPVAISEVQPGDRVWSVKDGSLRLSTVTWSGQTGVKPLLTIKTQNRTLRCTDNHPVLVAHHHRRAPGRPKPFYEHRWKAAGDLEVGDLIVTATKLPDHGVRSCPTRDEVSVGFMEFCGLLLGDGGVSSENGLPRTVRIARGDSARYMGHYRRVMAEEFVASAKGGRGTIATREQVPVAVREQARSTEFCSRLAAQELVDLGLSGDAHSKRVPAWVFQLAPDLRAAFLRGFCDADGSVDKKGHLSICLANEILLHQIRDLFISVGVPVSNIRCQRGWVTLPSGERFFSVSWLFKAAEPAANAAVIGSHDPVDMERMQNGKPWGRKAYRYPGRADEVPPDIEGCGHARIVSIEAGEIGVPVYDIEVPETHNFVCEGVVVHNSTFNNITTLREMAYTDALGPPLVLIEQTLNAHLVREILAEEDIFIEFDFAAILRGDRLKEIQALRDGVMSGLVTPNEGRGVLNLPHDEHPDADRIWMPTNNLAPIGGESPPAPPSRNGRASKEAARARLN